MQAITPELEAILKAKFQAGADGFRSRVEIGGVVTYDVPPELVGAEASSDMAQGTSVTVDVPAGVSAGDTLFIVIRMDRAAAITPSEAGWTEVVTGQHVAYVRVAGVSEPADYTFTWTGSRYHGAILTAFQGLDSTIAAMSLRQSDDQVCPAISLSNGEYVLIAVCETDRGSIVFTPPAGYTLLGEYDTGGSGFAHSAAAAAYRLYTGANPPAATWGVDPVPAGGSVLSHFALNVAVVGGGIPPTVLQNPQRVSIDKSLRLDADQAIIEIAEPAQAGVPLNWDSDVFKTNQHVRIYQWYGDLLNEVQTFTGLLDHIEVDRDPRKATLTCRDRMALLIGDTFSAIGPQRIHEAGAVRTEANGVYLDREVDYVVLDQLTRAGWPAADIDIGETSYVLREFIVADGENRASIVQNLGEMVGYSAWADELGVFHFQPTFTAGAALEPPDPAYTFRTGEDITELGDSTDQYDIRTRVKTRGPLVTLKDAWDELWRTRKINSPMDVWWDPAASGNIRVLAHNKRLYKLRQSDRVVLSSVYLGGSIPYPANVSGDPANPNVYWVMSCPWRYGGATTGNKLFKVRKSDNKVLAKYSLPSGNLRAMKVSSSYIWFVRTDTDRLYKRRKSDGSAIAHYAIDYWVHDPGIGSMVEQINPIAIMIDGTTLWVFWTNGNTMGRWLLSDEASPTVIDNAVYMSGARLHGTEIDTNAHDRCWGIHQANDIVAKFRLDTPFNEQVYAEVVDTELEDELGLLAAVQPREHDTHPTDPDHGFLVRRDTLDLPSIVSLAQATETASRRLELLNQRRRILDVGILGNPALQKTDTVRVEDPVTGIGRRFTVDTYRSLMGETYVGTVALVPIDEADEIVDDEGDVTEDVTIELVGVTSAVAEAATSVTIDVPVETVDDDIMLIRVFKDDTASVQAVTLAGWTQIGSDDEHSWFWRLAASEPATYAPSIPAARDIAAIMSVWRGVNTTNPIAGYAFSSVASETTPDSPAVMVGAGDYARVVACETDRGDETFTDPTEFEPMVSIDSTGSGDTAVAGSLAFQLYAGSDPPAATWTISVAAATRTDQIVLAQA
jgi:hypothetical protein